MRPHVGGMPDRTAVHLQLRVRGPLDVAHCCHTSVAPQFAGNGGPQLPHQEPQGVGRSRRSCPKATEPEALLLNGWSRSPWILVNVFAEAWDVYDPSWSLFEVPDMRDFNINPMALGWDSTQLYKWAWGWGLMQSNIHHGRLWWRLLFDWKFMNVDKYGGKERILASFVGEGWSWYVMKCTIHVTTQCADWFQTSSLLRLQLIVDINLTCMQQTVVRISWLS